MEYIKYSCLMIFKILLSVARKDSLVEIFKRKNRFRSVRYGDHTVSSVPLGHFTVKPELPTENTGSLTYSLLSGCAVTKVQNASSGFSTGNMLTFTACRGC